MADERRKRARLVFLVPLLALLAAAATLWLDHEHGLRPLFELSSEVDLLALRVSELEAERDRLRARARSLRRNDFEIEAAARETLGMIRPGERVVRLPE